MQTIRSKRPRSSPRGDVQAGCAYCDVQWLRSRLRRDRSGNLSCPDCRDYEGHDVVTLSELTAAAARRAPFKSKWSAENYHNDVSAGSVLHRTTAEDITR